MQGSFPCYFFEGILELLLRTESQRIGNFSQTFIGLPQIVFGSLDFLLVDISGQGHSHVLVEVIGKIGVVVAQMISDVLHADLLIQMLLNITIDFCEGRIFKRRMLGIRDTLGKV